MAYRQRNGWDDLPPAYTPPPTYGQHDNPHFTFEMKDFLASYSQSPSFSEDLVEQPSNTGTPGLELLTEIFGHNEHFILSRAAHGVHILDSCGERTLLATTGLHNIPLTSTSTPSGTTQLRKKRAQFYSQRVDNVLLKLEMSDDEGGAKKMATIFTHAGDCLGHIRAVSDNGQLTSASSIEVTDQLRNQIIRVEFPRDLFLREVRTGVRDRVRCQFLQSSDGLEIGATWERDGNANVEIPGHVPTKMKALILIITYLMFQKHFSRDYSATINSPSGPAIRRPVRQEDAMSCHKYFCKVERGCLAFCCCSSIFLIGVVFIVLASLGILTKWVPPDDLMEGGTTPSDLNNF